MEGAMDQRKRNTGGQQIAYNAGKNHHKAQVGFQQLAVVFGTALYQQVPFSFYRLWLQHDLN